MFGGGAVHSCAGRRAGSRWAGAVGRCARAGHLPATDRGLAVGRTFRYGNRDRRIHRGSGNARRQDRQLPHEVRLLAWRHWCRRRLVGRRCGRGYAALRSSSRGARPPACGRPPRRDRGAARSQCCASAASRRRHGQEPGRGRRAPGTHRPGGCRLRRDRHHRARREGAGPRTTVRRSRARPPRRRSRRLPPADPRRA